ncbi:MAG TPA: serine/threonine-protein kinase [Polyangiaceae bacterium]|nr:serine/threonine-protein kinase [Polyangiaceae bacterium]
MTLEPGPSTDRILRLCEGTPYCPERLLGRGGMGQIYIVTHRELEKQFAMKVLHPHHENSARLAERMRIEAQAMARLAHPNIVKVIDFWVPADGAPCFIMELLQGHTVGEELFERRRIPSVEVIEWGCQTLDALAAAHDIGVVHRDITPENLFLHQLEHQPRQLKLLDFGIARILDEVSEMTPTPLRKPTQSGTRIGSPRFMSPEGARGQKVDHRADIYSLGLTLYVAFTGKDPYEVRQASELVPTGHPGAKHGSLGLDTILERALEPKREDRYQTAREFLADLTSLRPIRRHSSPWQQFRR